ncbi:hypothetical protein V6N13_127799 [Hibiscus sabdariffa]
MAERGAEKSRSFAGAEKKDYAIISKWGNVIKIDDDTMNRNRFDYARVLASVSSLSDVPCDACVELNGDKFLIKMSTVEFEDNCCWLDDDCPVNNSVEENSCRFEDIPHAFNVSEAPFSPRAEWARNNNDNVLNGDPTLLKEENVDCNSSRSFSKDITAQVRVSGPDSLHNVPILVASDNSMSSTGYSEPIVPVLDKESDGLAIENNASMEAMEGEACECLEVCNAAGLFFNATDKEVGKRFVELESELGDPKNFEKKAAVKRLIFTSKASIFFLQETKLQVVDDRVVRQLCGKVDFLNWIYSPSIGFAGGLLSLWDPKVFECRGKFVHRNFIIMEGKIHVQSKCLVCTVVNVYAPNRPAERSIVFRELNEILSSYNLPIIMGGEFNIVCKTEERVGVSTKRGEIREFSDFIDALNLIDPPLSGGAFTWSNFREMPAFSRFDRWFDFWEDDKELVESLHVLCLNMRGIGIGNILRRCKKGVKFCLFQKKFDKQDSIPVMENIISILEADLANGIQISTSGVEL